MPGYSVGERSVRSHVHKFSAPVSLPPASDIHEGLMTELRMSCALSLTAQVPGRVDAQPPEAAGGEAAERRR